MRMMSSVLVSDAVDGGNEQVASSRASGTNRGGGNHRDASDSALSPKVKKKVILAVGSSGDDGASIKDIKSSAALKGKHNKLGRIIKEHLSEEIEVKLVDGMNRFYIKESYREMYHAMEKEISLRASETYLKDELKQEIVLFVGAAGDKGATPNQLLKSFEGFKKGGRDLSGLQCNALDVIKEHLSEEIEVVNNMLFIKETYLEAYRELKAEAAAEQFISVEDLRLPTRMRRDVIRVGSEGTGRGEKNVEGVAANKVLKEVKGLRRLCSRREPYSVRLQFSLRRFDDIVRVHFGSDIEKRLVPKGGSTNKKQAKYFIIKRDFFEERGGYV
ncbi:hypothetical protein ACHAWF_003924 [Thalassiosira exigua]